MDTIFDACLLIFEVLIEGTESHQQLLGIEPGSSHSRVKAIPEKSRMSLVYVYSNFYTYLPISMMQSP